MADAHPLFQLKHTVGLGICSTMTGCVFKTLANTQMITGGTKMSYQNYWQNLLNQPVEIECNDGTVHYGIIDSFDQENVYLRPLDNDQTPAETRNNDERFFGLGVGAPAFLGGFAGGLLGVGLGSIIGVRPCPYCPPGPYPYGPGPRPPYYGGGFYGPGPGPFYY